MTIDEVILYEDLSWEAFKKSLATLIISGSLGSGLIGAGYKIASNIQPRETSTSIKIKADPELTKIGRETIKTLPLALRNKIGNPNDIIFVKGMPLGGRDNAICQIGLGANQNVVYVNPKFVNKFLDGAGDQLSAHELDHYAQNRMSKKSQDSWPATNPDESKMYGQMTRPDAWKILINLRKHGDRMWNHSREEQAMIVQQREAQVDILQKLNSFSKTDYVKKQIENTKEKIAIYDEYINDYNQEN